MNLSITGRQVEQLVAHAELLIAWNKKINLTRITSVKDMAVKHFLDSMTALPYLPKSGRVLDIGSGAGFPGLVLKIMRPELEVTLIDGVRKKASFLQHVIRTLKLKNISVHHARAEEFKTCLPRKALTRPFYHGRFLPSGISSCWPLLFWHQMASSLPTREK